LASQLIAIIMPYNRLLILIAPIFILILLEILLFWPSMIYAVLVLACLLIIIAYWRFINTSQSISSQWSFIILPILLLISSIAYTSILSSHNTIQIIFILDAIFIYYYLKYLYYYLIMPVLYEEYIFNNIFTYGIFLTFFYTASAIYAFQSFLYLPIWPLIFVIFFITALIFYQILAIDKIALNKGIIYILISCLVLVELAWSIFYLPFNYNISGLALTVCYYVLVRLLRLFFINSLNKRIVRLYAIFGLIIIFLIIATARWI